MSEIKSVRTLILPLCFYTAGTSRNWRRYGIRLTEGERVRAGLHIRRDVVPCVTTLRHVPDDARDLDEQLLRTCYRTPDQKCWLIRTDTEPSRALSAYLDAV